ncbi:MAG: S9 family peptidase, partial [bacterium]|nr:S9 family peptidase [bacterium]
MVAAPYGSWDSPVTISMLTEAGTPLSGVTTDGDDLYWTEARALEGGRVAIVRRDAHGLVSDVVPTGFNSRSRIHEYGGGSYAVADGVLVSCDFADQRVYRIEGGVATAITPEPKIPAGDRYGDFEFHGDRLICVRERHLEDREPVNTLVTFAIDGSEEPRVIATG